MSKDGCATSTADVRYEARMRAWQEPADVEFPNPEAAAAYGERVALLRDAVELRRPARVPISPAIGLFAVRYGGCTARDAFYDRAKLATAMRRFHEDFLPDTLQSSFIMIPAEVFDLLDYHMYRWPGHGTGDDVGYQYVEAEYMRAGEYDELISDPSAFWGRRFLPRVFGAFEPLQDLGSLADLLEISSAAPSLAYFGRPDVQQMLHRLMAAGDAALRWIEDVIAIDAGITGALGIPDFAGGGCLAPYDMLADTMRGTRGAMLDGFRRPAQVAAAVERLVPIAIEAGVSSAAESGNPFIFMPLHKGADGFMSDRDFRTIYWPSLKAVIKGLIAEGLVPQLFVEGSFDSRLDVIVDEDIPSGRTVWLFDATDMTAVRDRFRGFACFGGNVPGAVLAVGTPEDVDGYVKGLVASVAGDGGFILSTGVIVDDAPVKNIRALMQAGRRYGA